MSDQDSKFASDPNSQFVWGAEAIGAVINQPPRSVYSLAAAGRIPVRRVGGKLVGVREDLRDLSRWPQEGK